MAAAPITWPDVLLIAAELDGLSEATRAAILAYVNTALNENAFKPAAFKLARMYLAAHLGELSATDGELVGGPVTSETEGGISKTYATAATTSVALDNTSYGAVYQQLVKTSRARFPFVLKG